MLVKKLIPCIYLYRGHAVRSLKDTSVVETEPLRLVQLYNENNADGLIVFDMSGMDIEYGEDTIHDDTAHEEALDIIKEICAAAEMDVIGAGNVKRMEDIKKLLYAGCRRAVLDFEKEGNVAITEEVSLKFGRDKILASYEKAETVSVHKELLEQYVSELILMNPHQIRETENVIQLPFLVQINQIALNKLMEVFAYDQVSCVTGNTINDNYFEITALKGLCRENGIMVESFSGYHVCAA